MTPSDDEHEASAAGGSRCRAGPAATEDDERLAERLAHQWAHASATSGAPSRAPIAAGPSNFSRAQVPWGVDLAAAWAWRFLVIAAAGYVIFWLLGFFAVVDAAGRGRAADHRAGQPGGRRGCSGSGIPRGLGGAARGPRRHRRRRGAADLRRPAGRQRRTDLADQTVEGLGEIKDWLKTGRCTPATPRSTTTSSRPRRRSREQSRTARSLGQVTEVGTAVGHVLAGFFIVLFSTYFFLADGDRIWAWVVRLAPRAARERVDSSGRVAWISLTQFVRATVIVARADAIGIMIGAAILGVPFVLAIGVLVFLGAFVPMVGATVAGTVAVLVALVDQGPVTALLMLGGRDPGAADRGPRPAAVPDGPVGLGAPARRDRRDRLRRARRPASPGALVAVPLAAAAQRRRPAPRQLHRRRRGRPGGGSSAEDSTRRRRLSDPPRPEDPRRTATVTERADA